ncbi:acyl-CoA dehydrogenase family protein [Rhodococcus sp. CSLK01-03]|uniref:Acyl-CoA dehydrogenase family protein n=1 Tax=Rhodococcus indonesiensis TaxID=3055869 RepID=A0ABT7RNY8_9NOCA|nr:acyl-CoA dehydrogenase family protein [Rhodococcus indonesiensis]MDM7489343.1 acyl-CoA dehydrogenase family protein [Rhodococcus indonesiensis]
MDASDGPLHAELRRHVRATLADLLPSDWRGLGSLREGERAEFLVSWRKSLFDGGWLVPSWPEEYGGADMDPVAESIIAEECIRVGLSHMPMPNDPFSFHLLGSTLLRWGTDEQKSRFLSDTVAGKIRWAQGFSEPDAGSDLFALSTRARLEGDEWIIDGQKIWQTAGTTANWVFALVRTDPAAARSAGISFMLIDLDQPGVEVRGIRNMAGEIEFAEIFFTEARTATSNVVGGVGNGARVALTLLGFERSASPVPGALASEIELRRLVALAGATGRKNDPEIRRRLARCYATVHALRCVGMRILTAASESHAPGPESSIVKLVQSEYQQTVTELALDILGDGVLAPSGDATIAALGPQPLGLDPLSSRAWVTDFLHARPGTVYGGASEVQRNTIAEQVLGLPREPRTSESR